MLTLATMHGNVKEPPHARVFLVKLHVLSATTFHRKSCRGRGGDISLSLMNGGGEAGRGPDGQSGGSESKSRWQKGSRTAGTAT